MDEIPMNTSVPIHKWVDIDESERDCCRCTDRVDCVGDFFAVCNQSIYQRINILMLRAEMFHNRHSRISIMFADEASSLSIPRFL